MVEDEGELAGKIQAAASGIAGNEGKIVALNRMETGLGLDDLDENIAGRSTIQIDFFPDRQAYDEYRAIMEAQNDDIGTTLGQDVECVVILDENKIFINRENILPAFREELEKAGCLAAPETLPSPFPEKPSIPRPPS